MNLLEILISFQLKRLIRRRFKSTKNVNDYMKRDYLKNKTFDDSFPFEPHYMELNGFKMHYIDEGSGDPILCLHGMPTWGYLYRNFIEKLSKGFRVVVPDQMGFGKSDVPENKRYLMEEHVSNLKKFILKLDLRKITLIIQDWGGPIGFGFAVDYPERIKALVIMNTSVGVMKEGRKPWYAPLEEKGIYSEFIKNVSNLIKMGIYNKDKITETLLKAYSAPFTKEGSYKGALAWPKDIPIGDSHPSAEIMRHVRNNLKNLKEKPKVLIWGMKDPIFPEKMISWWQKIYPNIEVHRIEEASHFLQEDAPDKIISIIQNFLRQVN